MFTTAYLVCLVSAVLTAFCAIPADLRAAIGRNCLGSNGRIKLRYLIREMSAVGGFFGQLLFGAILLGFLALYVLVIIDEYCFSLNLFAKAASQAEWDSEAWERNLRSSPNNVEAEFLGAHIRDGGTKESARQTMGILWSLVPAVFAFCFAVLVVLLRFASTSYHNALQHLARQESDRDLRRIKRRYLSSTAQSRHA